MARVVGIDTGKSGAIAVIEIDNKCKPTDVYVVPFDSEKYKNIIQHCKETNCNIAFVEKVHAMPGQGVVSMFNFGHNVGFIEGMLHYGDMAYIMVTPQKWKKEMGVTSDKQTSIDLCKQLFPNVNLKRTQRSRKDNDGMAEAILIAEYGRRLIEEEGFGKWLK